MEGSDSGGVTLAVKEDPEGAICHGVSILNDDLVNMDKFVLGPEPIQGPKILNAVNEEKCLELEILSPEPKTEPGSYTFTDSLHHIEKKNAYVCDSCGKSFLNEHDLLHHIKTHLPEISESLTKESLLIRVSNYKKPYSCDECKKSFTQLHDLKRHKIIHTGEKPYTCGVCKKGWTQKSTLKVHMRIHTGEKPYECPNCEKRFAQWSALEVHKRTHTGDKPYSCEKCLNKFRHLNTFKNHKCIHTEVNVPNGLKDDLLIKDQFVLAPELRQCPKIVNAVNEEKCLEIVISSPEPKTVPGSYTFTDSLHHINQTNTYVCDSCGKEFLHKLDLIYHIRTHRRESSDSLTKESLLTREPVYKKPYSCDVCKKNFSRIPDLKRHKQSHTGEKPYLCGICTKGCTRMSDLKAHMRIHTGEKPYECPICEERFSQYSGLRRHKRSHTGDKPYFCEICKKEFTDLGDLKTHKQIHSGEKPYLPQSLLTAVKMETTDPSQVRENLKCESSTDCVSETGLYAGHVVKDELMLGPVELHRRKEDDNSREEKCLEIEILSPELQTEPGSYTFTDSLHHSDPKNTYACDLCAKEFLHKHDLIDHIKTHLRESSDSLTIESLLTREPIYEKPYSCDVCKKSFSKLAHLKTHKRSHTGEKPYICGICNKGCTRMSHLKEHIRIHTGDKPYECPICEKRFSQNRGLVRHRKRSHTGDKSYFCEICKKEFTALGDLKTHKQIHSGEKPYLSHSLLVETTVPSQVREDLKCESSTDCVSETGLYAGHVVKDELVLGPVELHRRKEDDNSREEKCLEIEILIPELQTEPGSYTFTDSLHHIDQKNTYACESCGKRFLNELDLIDHIKTHLPESSESLTNESLLTLEPIYEKTYSCDVCNKNFTKITDLKRHKRSHTGEKPCIYICGVCNKGCTRMSDLMAHLRIHTGEKPYECPIFEERFSQYTGETPYQPHSLLTAVKVEVTDPSQVKEEFRCESSTDCVSETGLYAGHVVKDELVLGPVELHRRKEDENPREEKLLEIEILNPELKTVPGSYTFTDSLHHIEKKNTYVCDSCGKTFLHKPDLIDHVKTHLRENSESLIKESDSKSLTKVACKICNKKFRKDYLKIHERCHTGAKPYSCEVCKRAFANLCNLKNHKRVHTEERPYSCDVCKKSFSRLNHLKTHKRSHTGEKPYTCGVCKKGFTQTANLKSHIRIHTGEKPYECPICEKRFAQGSSLETHKRTHTGDQPYSCEICKKKFVHVSSLNEHKCIHAELNVGKMGARHGLNDDLVIKDQFVLGSQPIQCPKIADAVNEEKLREIEISDPELKTVPGSYSFTDSLHHNEKRNTDVCDSLPVLGSFKEHKRIHTERPYACDVCKKCFSTLTYLKTHKRSHTGEKPYTCGVCKKGFTQIANLKSHIRVHTGEKPYECPICERRFSQWCSLDKHKRTHIGDDPYSCEICKEKFMHLRSLETHKVIHAELNVGKTGERHGLNDDLVIKDQFVLGSQPIQCPKIADTVNEEKREEIETASPGLKTLPGSNTFTDSLHFIEKNNPYVCDACSKTFLHKYDLIDHVKAHLRENSESWRFSCDVCKKDFTRLDYLKKHKLTHTGEKPYACEVCKKAFAQISNLKTHTRTHKRIDERLHTGPKPYSCEVCKKEFAYLDNLKYHEHTHTDKRSYSCDVCKKNFSRFDYLKTHKRTHSGEKPYACEVCKKGFAQINNLKRHTRIHTRIDERLHTGPKPYSCEVCKKEFADLDNLKDHERNHTVERPYSCDVCKKDFSRLDSLLNHKRTHSGEKPFACEVCKRGFAQKNNLTRHTRIHTR